MPGTHLLNKSKSMTFYGSSAHKYVSVSVQPGSHR